MHGGVEGGAVLSSVCTVCSLIFIAYCNRLWVAQINSYVKLYQLNSVVFQEGNVMVLCSINR